MKNERIDHKTIIYTAKRDFGRIDNKISKNVLDSLISSLPYWRLDKYKTTVLGESYAVQFLRKELTLKGLKSNEFIIYEIKKDKDFSYTFYLNHIDSYIYTFNLDKANADLAKATSPEGIIEEIPPITGNVSGHEGWYTVDMEKNTLEIIYGQ